MLQQQTNIIPKDTAKTFQHFSYKVFKSVDNSVI